MSSPSKKARKKDSNVNVNSSAEGENLVQDADMEDELNEAELYEDEEGKQNNKFPSFDC